MQGLPAPLDTLVSLVLFLPSTTYHAVVMTRTYSDIPLVYAHVFLHLLLFNACLLPAHRPHPPPSSMGKGGHTVVENLKPLEDTGLSWISTAHTVSGT